MINATQLREGMIVVHEGDLYRVASVKPGAFFQPLKKAVVKLAKYHLLSRDILK